MTHPLKDSTETEAQFLERIDCLAPDEWGDIHIEAQDLAILTALVQHWRGLALDLLRETPKG